MFRFFDKNQDGYLDFEEYIFPLTSSSFLQMTLPNDDVNTRSIATQRPNYRVNKTDKLAKHIEFELSRFLEK